MSSIQRNGIISFLICEKCDFLFQQVFHHLRKNVKAAEKEDVRSSGIILGNIGPKQENNFKY